MISLKLVAADAADLRDQLRNILTGGPISMPGALGINPLNKSVDSHWEQAKQLGYREGYNAGFGEACDRATMAQRQSDFAEVDQAAEPSPLSDEPTALALGHAARVEELRQASAQAAVPGPAADAWANQAEANRKTAAAIGEQRAQYYAERETPLVPRQSVSSPEVVAETLKQQRHLLPGE